MFYDLDGYEVSIESIRNEMIANYDGDLTDFNDGSEILSIYNGIATAVYGLREQLDTVLRFMLILLLMQSWMRLLLNRKLI